METIFLHFPRECYNVRVTKNEKNGERGCCYCRKKWLSFRMKKIYDRITRHDAITQINQENLIKKKKRKKQKILLRKGIFSALAIISDSYA